MSAIIDLMCNHKSLLKTHQSLLKVTHRSAKITKWAVLLIIHTASPRPNLNNNYVFFIYEVRRQLKNDVNRQLSELGLVLFWMVIGAEPDAIHLIT